MSTEQIIDCWQNGIEPYTMNTEKCTCGSKIAKHKLPSGYAINVCPKTLAQFKKENPTQ